MFINVQPYVAQTLNLNPHGGYSNPFSMIGGSKQMHTQINQQNPLTAMLDLENFDISSHDESIGQTSSVDYDQQPLFKSSMLPSHHAKHESRYSTISA